MFKWVILFILCCCLAPDITRRIKAAESQQEVRRREKGNVVFYLHPASVSEFISAVTADCLLTAACSTVDRTPVYGMRVCVCLCGCVLKQQKTGKTVCYSKQVCVLCPVLKLKLSDLHLNALIACLHLGSEA